jgi:hypothetical protein
MSCLDVGGEITFSYPFTAGAVSLNQYLESKEESPARNKKRWSGFTFLRAA